MKLLWFGVGLILVAGHAWPQGSAAPTDQYSIEDYLGLWEAFREGAMPIAADGEEPSKLVIYRDSADRVVVLLTYRVFVSPEPGATRQINFAYGIARLVEGGLVFRDQHGFTNRVVVGRDAQHGRYLEVVPEPPDIEGDLGSFRRISVR
jgi:hypothetical protein